MSDRPDWEAKSRDIANDCFDIGTTTDAYDVMRKRIETELSKAWVAGQEGGPDQKEEPDPCQSLVESVEVVIQTCIRTTTDKKVVSRHRSTTKLDPAQFTCNQSRQFEYEYGRDHKDFGKPVNHVPIGNPHLVLQGVVIGGENDPLLEPRHPDLRAEVEKVANLIKFRMIWKDTLVYEHETTEQDLLDTPFRTHAVQIMHRTRARIGQEDNYDLSFGQIRRALFDVSKETMEAYQL